MKTRLKLDWPVFMVMALTSLLPTARAFYAPSEQRWLNRDPKWEEGSAELRRVSRRGNTTVIDRSRRLGTKRNFEDLYVFVLNSPPNRKDSLGLDSPGCDFIPDSWESACMLECCARHDECFDDNDCSWLSWFCPWTDCGHCNLEVVGCMFQCLGGYGDNPDRPNYYCGQCHEYFDLPNPADINNPQINPHFGHNTN